MDNIAQASCVGLNDKEGWVYAVRRYCGNTRSCETICKSGSLKAQDIQIRSKTYVLQPEFYRFQQIQNPRFKNTHHLIIYISSKLILLVEHAKMLSMSMLKGPNWQQLNGLDQKFIDTNHVLELVVVLTIVAADFSDLLDSYEGSVQISNDERHDKIFFIHTSRLKYEAENL